MKNFDSDRRERHIKMKLMDKKIKAMCIVISGNIIKWVETGWAFYIFITLGSTSEDDIIDGVSLRGHRKEAEFGMGRVDIKGELREFFFSNLFPL